MIKRLIKYLVIERKIEYIQYKSSLKSSNARNCINYSTLKATSIKISTNVVIDNATSNNILKKNFQKL